MKLRGNCSGEGGTRRSVEDTRRVSGRIEGIRKPVLYITSTTGETARIYPMKVWSEIEDKLAQTPSTNRAKRKFSDADELLRADGGVGWRQGRLLLADRVARSGANQGRCGRPWESGLPGSDESCEGIGSVEETSRTRTKTTRH